MVGPALGLSEIRLLGWTFCIALHVLHAVSVPALDTDLLLSQLLLRCSLGGSRWWLKCLGPCHPHEDQIESQAWLAHRHLGTEPTDKRCLPISVSAFQNVYLKQKKSECWTKLISEIPNVFCILGAVLRVGYSSE